MFMYLHNTCTVLLHVNEASFTHYCHTGRRVDRGWRTVTLRWWRHTRDTKRLLAISQTGDLSEQTTQKSLMNWLLHTSTKRKICLWVLIIANDTMIIISLRCLFLESWRSGPTVLRRPELPWMAAKPLHWKHAFDAQRSCQQRQSLQVCDQKITNEILLYEEMCISGLKLIKKRVNDNNICSLKRLTSTNLSTSWTCEFRTD